MARHFYKSLRPDQRNIPYEIDNFFIVHPAGPLKQYMSRHFQPRTQYEDVAAWGKAAIVFGDYGRFLVKRHPMEFVQYYILPNTKNYFIPTMGKFSIYNMGEDKLWRPGQRWFHYASPDIWSISKTGQATLLGLFPYLFMLLNIYFVLSFYLFLRRGGLRSKERFYIASLLIVTLFLLLNFAFSVFATCVTLRYEIFPMIVLLAFSMLLTDWLEAHMIRKPAPKPATVVRPA